VITARTARLIRHHDPARDLLVMGRKEALAILQNP